MFMIFYKKTFTENHKAQRKKKFSEKYVHLNLTYIYT